MREEEPSPCSMLPRRDINVAISRCKPWRSLVNTSTHSSGPRAADTSWEPMRVEAEGVADVSLSSIGVDAEASRSAAASIYSDTCFKRFFLYTLLKWLSLCVRRKKSLMYLDIHGIQDLMQQKSQRDRRAKYCRTFHFCLLLLSY